MDKLEVLKAGVVSTTQGVWNAIIDFLPKFIIAVIIALIGYFIAVTLEKVTIKIAKKLKLDSLLRKTNLDEQLDDAGVKMSVSRMLGIAVKWIVLIIMLLVVAGLFKLGAVQSFIINILGVIGNIIIALFIFAIAVYAGRFAGAIGKAVAEYVEFQNSRLVADIVKAIIYFIAFIQILGVLGATQAVGLVMGLVQAVFYGVALAVGIAFGLGGQEKAKHFIERLRK